MEQPDEQHRHEQHRVRVGYSDHLKSCIRQKPGEGSARVSPQLAAQDRMIPAKHRHGRDVDEEIASRSQETEHLRDRRTICRFVERVKHVEGSHKIEDSAAKWHGRR